MPIKFTCPHCGATTDMADQYAGQSGPCAHCGKPITVPAPDIAAGYAPPAKKSGMPVLVIVLVAVLGVAVVCGGILVALLLPAVQAAREAARRAQCCNNLKQINLAMLNYESVWKCFPPAYIADEDGKPMHSWRVLILPFLEQQYLYEQYNFDEPWDGPNNRKLADMMPSIYRCPSEGDRTGNKTSYAVIVGPGPDQWLPGPPKLGSPVFEADRPCGLTYIRDGTSNTILVVEASGAGINWMEPRDLDGETMPLAINDDSGTGIQSRHPGGVNTAFCDGSVHFLPNSLDRETLRRLIYRDDGEPVDYSRF